MAESKKPKETTEHTDPLEHLPPEQREAFKKFLELQKKGADIDRLFAVVEKEEKEESVLRLKKDLVVKQEITLKGFIADLKSTDSSYFHGLTIKEIAEAALVDHVTYLKKQIELGSTKKATDGEKRTRSANLTADEIAEGKKAVLEALSSNVVTNGRKGGLNKSEISEKIPGIKDQQVIRGIKDLKDAKVIVIEGEKRNAKYYIA